MENVNKLSMKEKLGYASGDLACNLIFQTISIFLLFFYTDVFGISAAAASTLFFVARLWDAINDPIMGAIVDKTNTRWGKFRPYLLWGAIPFGILATLCFTTPDLSYTGKLIYAYVTYIGLGMVYTFVNVPYGALTSSMTQDSKERASLSAIRMFFAQVGGLTVVLGVPYLSSVLGKGNNALGYQLTIAIFAIIGVVLLFITFATTKERYTIKENKVSKESDKSKERHVKGGFKGAVNILKTNRPLQTLCIVFVVLFGTISISNSVGLYFFKYNLNRPGLFSLNQSLGIVFMLITLLFVPLMTKKVEKKQLLRYGLVLCLVRPISMMFTYVPIILAGTVIGYIGIGIAAGLLWGLVPDTIEYGQYKTGVRAEGMTYAIVGFAFKLGMALGGLIPGYVLHWTGYVPDAVQTSMALVGIKSLVSILPIVLTLIAIISLNYYSLDEKTHKNIIAELNKEGA